jgi:DNA repair ATPase RecN
MIVEQSKDIEEIKNEFSNASNLMQEKYTRLNENFQELQELYEGRPSRPEDLVMIRD